MPQIGKRLLPPEGVEPKIGDVVKFEIIFGDGKTGTMMLVVSPFDSI